MLAAVFEGIEQITLREVERPPIGPGDLLVRVRAAAICGTDIRIYKGQKTKGVRIPSILGHEIAGDIVERGSEVSEWAIGDRIVVAPVISCGTCYYCLHGLWNVCNNRTALGYEYDGGFAQYMRVPADALRAGNVFAVPDHISHVEASLSEPLSCCINGQENLGILPGDTVLVVGAGPIGIMHIQLVKALADTRVFVAEPDESRRRLAEEFCADIAFDPRSVDTRQLMMEETNGLGLDKIIMAVGLPAAVNDLMVCLRKGGGINLFAGFPAGCQSAVDPNLVHYNQIKISGASASTTKQVKQALDAISAGHVDAKHIATHQFTLHDFDKALESTLALNGLKTVIVPE
jgi:L-iditol 2-dehydrogenase